jgi:hypothetical protein
LLQRRLDQGVPHNLGHIFRQSGQKTLSVTGNQRVLIAKCQSKAEPNANVFGSARLIWPLGRV